MLFWDLPEIVESFQPLEDRQPQEVGKGVRRHAGLQFNPSCTPLWVCVFLHVTLSIWACFFAWELLRGLLRVLEHLAHSRRELLNDRELVTFNSFSVFVEWVMNYGGHWMEMPYWAPIFHQTHPWPQSSRRISFPCISPDRWASPIGLHVLVIGNSPLPKASIHRF